MLDGCAAVSQDRPGSGVGRGVPAGSCKGQDGAQPWVAGASLASCRLGSGSVQLAQLLARKLCRLMLEVVGVQDL